MTIWESIMTSWTSLKANKMRSFLTILGIVIGVSSVVFLVSFGRGHQANMTGIFESMGANAIYVTGSTRDQITGASGTLTLEDAEAISDPNRAPSVDVVAPMVEKMARVVYGNHNKTVDLIGVTPDIQYVLDYPVATGRFISDHDDSRRASVAVLGSKVAADLFDNTDPIGESIRVAGKQFEIVGVLEEKGAFMSQMDDIVMIPLTTYQTKIYMQTSPRGRPVQTIAVRAIDADEIDSATDQVIKILRQRHSIRANEDDDFTVMNMRQILDSMGQALGIFQVFLGAVGAISLIVGGIGIMNIMLVSVTERTREIGIRKAVGAKRRDILSQFLVEAAMLSLTGGVIGLLIAGCGALLVSGIKLGSYAVQAPIGMDIALIAIAVALIVGITSGAYPAFRAARLDPIESLRHD
jgi:putative ABC transport system permease protein